jgi:hypothetical protein
MVHTYLQEMKDSYDAATVNWSILKINALQQMCAPPPQIESVANCVSESSSQTNESSSQTNESSSQINEGNNNETIRNPCSEERRLTPLSRCTNSSFSSENNAAVAGKKRQEIAISTNKDNYEQGEAITMTVKNGGKQSLVFLMENSDFVIRNLKTGQTYKPSAVLGTLLIAPGATKEFFWNQQDDNNTQAISGNYSASVSIDSTKANTSFTVSQ